MTVTTEQPGLRHVAQIAATLLNEARRDWNAVAEAIGPLGTGRLLALDAALAHAGIDSDGRTPSCR
ncbi:MAG: hypothetical protein ACRDYX_20610 [Egibacteraceae bacterium]